MAIKITREWLTKRRSLYSFVFAFHICQYMVITSVMSFGALYLLYLKERYISYAYEIMLGCMVVTGCFSSLVFGRLVDLSGGLKEITIATQVIIVTSAVLYVVSPESIIVTIAYGLFGLSEGIIVMLRSELCKAYDKSIITTVQVIVRFGSVVGTALGCLMIILGIVAKIDVGSWHISGANFGIVVSGVEFGVLMLASFCSISNLSKEYNFKAQEVEKDFRARIEIETSNAGLLMNEDPINEDSYFKTSKDNPQTVYFSSLRVEIALLFRCLPTFKILCMSFLHGCISMSFERFLPLIGKDILSWQGIHLTLAYLFSCIPPLLAVILFWAKGRHLSDYQLLFGGYWFIALCGLTSGVLGIFVRKEVYGLVLFTFILPAHKLSWSFQDAVTAALFSKMIPSQSQCISEAIRYFVTACGMGIGALLTGIGYHNMIAYCGLLMSICCISFYFLWSEKDIYKNPKLLWVVNSQQEEFSEFDT